MGEVTFGQVIVDAMNMVGYDAMALGVKELQLGRDVLERRIAEARFPIVSANACWRAGEPIVDAYTVLAIGDHRVGVIGLTQPPDVPAEGFDVTDPADALARVLPEVAEVAHTIVLLTSLTPDEARVLAQRNPGLDLVIAGNAWSVPEEAERVAGTGTILVAADHPAQGHTGRQIGRLVATLTCDGAITMESWESVRMSKIIEDDREMARLLDRARIEAPQ